MGNQEFQVYAGYKIIAPISTFPLCDMINMIHEIRLYRSRRTISLLVTNPRITEWPNFILFINDKFIRWISLY